MTSDLSSLAIPAGELERSSNWRLKGSIVWGGLTRGQNAKLLSGKLSNQLLKLEAVSRSTTKVKVKQNWYRAGVAHLLVSKTEAQSESVPLGESFVVFPLAEQSYRLSVWPVQWLPNLKIKVWEYIGPIGSQAPTQDRLVQLVEQIASEFNAG